MVLQLPTNMLVTFTHATPARDQLRGMDSTPVVPSPENVFTKKQLGKYNKLIAASKDMTLSKASGAPTGDPL